MKAANSFALTIALSIAFAGCTPAKVDHTPTIYTQWPFDANEAKRRQKETAERLGVPVEKGVDFGGGAKLELVLIPAGEFVMGGDESPEEVDRKCVGAGIKPASFKPEHPQHLVRITKPFYMGKYEVTQEVWKQVMGNDPSHFKGARNPVEGVSWNTCQEFLKKLNDFGKDQGAFRLPTEAEWEYACRAGTATPFCFGQTISTDQGNYDGNYTYGSGQKGTCRQKTVAVGSFPINAWGLHDMHGNAWEWCSDWYGEGYYGESPKDDPAGPAEGSYRVLRGGSWFTLPVLCRSAYRFKFEPARRNYYYDLGLRVALTVVEP